MARTKAMSTRARELATDLTPDQLKQLAELLSQEAEKPRIDKKEYSRIRRELRSAYVKSAVSEERLSVLLAEAGKTNDEINAEISTLRREAEKDRISGAGTRKRGRPRKSE
jgi:hypothetical protein